VIAFLRGVLLKKSPGLVIVDVSGVGYGLTIPVSTYSELPDLEEEVELRVYTHVREDTLALYGFLQAAEKDLFEKLLSVSGVGPGLAVKILSGLPVGDLLEAIRTGDAKTLVRIPGVGRKTGERIILDLQDKVSRETVAGEIAAVESPGAKIEHDVISAMVNLGCSQDAAEKAVDAARGRGTPLEFEPLFRASMELVRR